MKKGGRDSLIVLKENQYSLTESFDRHSGRPRYIQKLHAHNSNHIWQVKRKKSTVNSHFWIKQRQRAKHVQCVALLRANQLEKLFILALAPARGAFQERACDYRILTPQTACTFSTMLFTPAYMSSAHR